MNKPVTLVLFGITGDLAQKKIIPALFDLYVRQELPLNTRIVGFSRRDFSPAEIQEFVRSFLPEGEDHSSFLERISYVQGNFTEGNAYKKLGEHLYSIDESLNGYSDKLFYLSVPPTFYESIALELSNSGLSIPCGGDEGFSRVLIEKPFGNDLKTAKKLDALLAQLFKEEQIFRIDHYLAKDSLLDLIELRKTNPDFEKKWNKEFISKIELNLFEKAVVGSRAASYDPVGAFRDVGQNHMLQMLALITMDIPPEVTPEAVHKTRAQALEALVPYSENDIASTKRAQYEGYRAELKKESEEEKQNESQTETFFSIEVRVSSERFKDVPFVLSSGKGLDRNCTEIVVYFKDGTVETFSISSKDSLSAYQKLLLDCIEGDQTIFTSTEEVLAEWEFVTPIEEKWKKVPLTSYTIGSSPEYIK